MFYNLTKKACPSWLNTRVGTMILPHGGAGEEETFFILDHHQYKALNPIRIIISHQHLSLDYSASSSDCFAILRFSRIISVEHHHRNTI